MKEKFKLIKYNEYPRECDACHYKFKTIYHLYVGDTDLIKLCKNCKELLKKEMNSKILENNS